MNLDSVREVVSALEEHGLSAKKRFGQNFLVDRNVRCAIVSLVDAEADEWVWEVGPGLGALTELVLQRGCRVVGFEIDHGLVALLRRTLAAYADVHLVPGDVTETWPGTLSETGTPASVVGNLPYSQAAAIIASFVESDLRVRQYLFMVQEEVGERMGAAVGTKAYSAFTVMIRSRCTVTRRMRIQPGSFYPRPEVSSALVELSPREDAPEIYDTQRLTTVTRAVFHARRKTVLNSIEQSAAPLGPGGRSLTREEVRDLLSEADIDPSVRGETLEVERITHLANETARLFGSRSEGARPE